MSFTTMKFRAWYFLTCNMQKLLECELSKFKVENSRFLSLV